MRSILPYALAVVCAASAWQPPPGHPQIPIWPHAAPGAIAGGGAEDEARTVQKKLVGGRPWIAVGNVIRPAITVYSPKSATAARGRRRGEGRATAYLSLIDLTSGDPTYVPAQ